MSEDTGGAQARELLRELHEHANRISHKVDIVAGRRRRARRHVGPWHNINSCPSLRQELHEAHRLIEGLRRRFPETLVTEHRYQ